MDTLKNKFDVFSYVSLLWGASLGVFKNIQYAFVEFVLVNIFPLQGIVNP